MENAAATGALIAAIIALSKTVEWFVTKYKQSKGTTSEAMLQSIHNKIIMAEKDIGDMKKDIDKVADAMVDIANAIKEASETNKEVVELVHKIDRRQEIRYAVEKDREKRRVANGE